jgi:hypothetical protein
MSPSSTTGSAPVGGEAQWAGADTDFTSSPSVRAPARSVPCTRGRDEDGVDDEPFTAVRGR